MPARRALLRGLVALATAAAVLVVSPPAQAGPSDWYKGFRKRAAEFAAQVRAGWHGLKEVQAPAAPAPVPEAVPAARNRPHPARPEPKIDPRILAELQQRSETAIASASFLSNAERSMVRAINAERVAAGLVPLTPDPNLVASARAHSASMRDAAKLFHTPRLAAVLPRAVRGRSVSENIGVGRSVESLQRTFMLSRSHRAAILGRYDRVGVGVVVVPGRTWVTQHFVRSG